MLFAEINFLHVFADIDLRTKFLLLADYELAFTVLHEGQAPSFWTQINASGWCEIIIPI